MPVVKCSTPDCPYTISYFCQPVTVLTGAQLTDKKRAELQAEKEKKIKRTLTLQCYNEHRNNYENLCDK
jgi:hypothetical protein